MRRTAVLLVAFVAVMALAVTVLASGPAQKFTVPVTGEQFVCDDAVYAITSGEVQIVIHEGSAAQGNQNFTTTVTPRKVVAEDESGDPVSIVGAFWVGGAFNANTGGEVFTFTDKFQILSTGGGTVGNVNVTFHVTAQPNNFVLNDFDLGNCSSPEV
ncbi:MAG: hypothetical protein ACRDVL_01995 [Acidimicrobiia bacterium]